MIRRNRVYPCGKFNTVEIDEVKKAYANAKSQWTNLHREYARANRFVNKPGGQWDEQVRSNRRQKGKPSMEFNELHTHIHQIVNSAKKSKKQIKISAGDGGNPDTAKILDAKLRHIQYVSQAENVYTHAMKGSTTGGFGFFEVTREYVTDDAARGDAAALFNQEPRLRRILDPTTVIFDLDGVKESDFSDAKACWIAQWITRDEYRDRFPGHEPLDWEPGGMTQDTEWNREDKVCIAAYWHVDITESTLCLLADGTSCFKEDVPKGEQPIATRPLTERAVYRDVIDGEKRLENTIWPCQWIGIIPVLGDEIIVDGKRVLNGAVTFSLDAQVLKNATGTSAARALSTANMAPFTGPKGSFKQPCWADGEDHAFLEWDPVVGPNGEMLQSPIQQRVETPIQALMSFYNLTSAHIRSSIGYNDQILQPSKGDLSGVAVQRREEQQDLTNFHFEDALIFSQWHAARVILSLLINLTDTSRPWQVMNEDDSISTVPVAVPNEDGFTPEVPGFEGKPHHRIDRGIYDVMISSEKPYLSRKEEESAALATIITADPALMPAFLDLYFKQQGYSDLEERAKLLLPPQIQQAVQAQQGGQQPIPPQVQAQMAQMQAQLQQVTQLLQKLGLEKMAKTADNSAKFDIEKLKQAGSIERERLKAHSKHTSDILGAQTEAIGKHLDMLHESELAPDPNAQPQGQA